MTYLNGVYVLKFSVGSALNLLKSMSYSTIKKVFSALLWIKMKSDEGAAIHNRMMTSTDERYAHNWYNLRDHL